jgi:hypothetical protein
MTTNQGELIAGAPKAAADSARSGRIPTFVLELLWVGLPLLAFFVYMHRVAFVNWGQGGQRTVWLVLGLLVALMVMSRKELSLSTNLIVVLLAIVLSGLVVIRVVEFVFAVRAPESEVAYSDMARTTIDSVALIRRGENPYTTEIDPWGAENIPSGLQSGHFAGFKYGPLTPLLFGPKVLSFGRDGYLAANLVLALLTAGAAAWWAFIRNGNSAALGAAALVLIPSFLGFELFSEGANDLAAVSLGILAFAGRSARLPVLSGVLLGLSFAAKPLPAAAFAIPMLFAGESKKRFAAASTLTSLIVYLPWLIASPVELMSNLFVFNLLRPPETTSLLVSVSPVVRGVARTLSVGAIAAIPFVFRKRLVDGTPRRVAAVAAVATILFFLGGTHIHRHYLLWLLPALAVATATTLWGAGVHKEGGSGGVAAPRGYEPGAPGAAIPPR